MRFLPDRRTNLNKIIRSWLARSRKKPPPGRGLDFWLIRVNPRPKKLLLGRFGLCVLAAEALDAAGGVHQLLLAGEKGMAGGADFNTDVALMGRPGHKCVATRAMHAHFVVS